MRDKQVSSTADFVVYHSGRLSADRSHAERSVGAIRNKVKFFSGLIERML